MTQTSNSKSLNAIHSLAYLLLAAFMSVGSARAETLSYTLNDVFLIDGTQITGAFDWTYTIGDFEGGVGVFTALEIPWRPGGTAPPLEQAGMILTLENNQIEISLDGNFHDYGLDISLKFLQSLSPAMPSYVDLVNSKFECCGNGFKDQLFSSGSVSPLDQDGDGAFDSVDNCILAANAGQEDADADGHGNICDGDFNNDCLTNIFDLFAFKDAFGNPSADAQFDLNSTGGAITVNIFDFFVFKGLFGTPPGSSPVGSLCNP